MTHGPYILAAYLVSALTLVGLIGWVLFDLFTQDRKLRRLEAGGRRAERRR
jgi:heme exporter protein CcmD